MADMPAYHPDSLAAGAMDDFADNLSGDVYGAARPAGSGGVRHGLYGIAQTQLLTLADSGKMELVRNVAGVVGLIRTVARQVESFGVEPYAGYARQTTALVDDLHDSIVEKSVEELIEDGRALVRQQPEIAVAAAVIMGFIGARLFKARA